MCTSGTKKLETFDLLKCQGSSTSKKSDRPILVSFADVNEPLVFMRCGQASPINTLTVEVRWFDGGSVRLLYGGRQQVVLLLSDGNER